MELFFVLSGFILGLHHLKHYLKDSNKVSLKSYFLRRVNRLEPPYIIVMFLLLIGNVFVSKNLNTTEGFQSFLKHLLYTFIILFIQNLHSSIRLLGVWKLKFSFIF